MQEYGRLCQTIHLLLTQNCKLKEFRGHSELEKARNHMKKAEVKEDKEEQKAEALKTKKRKNEQDELLKQVDREAKRKT